MPGLLYPAYQKFYSAISCLERFRKEQDFFENISCLDTFFSEYRSITLVMQKSLAHTPHMDTYKKLVATECFDPWLNTQRVKSVHTHPVEFTKKVDVSIYFPDRGIDLLSESFSVEDDVPLSSLNTTLKAVFERIDPTEVFFSAKCSFPEKDTGEDVLRKALSGLTSMQVFMDKMHSAVGEDCPLCNQLRDKISHSNIQLPKITPHVCRHTFCTNMAKNGMNPKTLQYIMGHADISITVNIKNRNTNTSNRQSRLILKVKTVCSANAGNIRFLRCVQ